MNATATASPVSPNPSYAMGSPRLPVLENGHGPIVRAGMFRLRRGYPTEHGGKRQADQLAELTSSNSAFV